MKGRSRVAVARGGGAPTDLLPCFPSSVHLALMPKPICSPSRPADFTKHHPARPTNRGHSSSLFPTNTSIHSGGAAAGGGTDDVMDEPTSPKVTCAGQIKVRPRSTSGRKPTTTSATDSKGWLSLMEEMEGLHRNGKKPLMHIFCLLRGIIRFDLRCFGSFHATADCSTDENGAYEEEDGVKMEEDNDLESRESRTVLTEWFMVLENQGCGLIEEELIKEVDVKDKRVEEEEVVPPPNALLLMRCRSAPTKRGEKHVSEQDKEEIIEKEKVKAKEKEMGRFLMSYAPNFMKLSTEIAKETWVVGKFDPTAGSLSLKR